MIRPKRDPDGRVASPYQSRCRIDALGVCQGCGRTINEIMDWYDADDATRLQRLPKRSRAYVEGRR